MCATIVEQAVVPLVGGKGHCTGRQTTSSKHWRYGTTRVCRTGWRSPLLTGAASLVRIFLLPRVPRGKTRTSQNPAAAKFAEYPFPRTPVNSVRWLLGVEVKEGMLRWTWAGHDAA